MLCHVGASIRGVRKPDLSKHSSGLRPSGTNIRVGGSDLDDLTRLYDPRVWNRCLLGGPAELLVECESLGSGTDQMLKRVADCTVAWPCGRVRAAQWVSGRTHAKVETLTPIHNVIKSRALLRSC